MENESDWLTYAEVGERLGISKEAARQRAKRGRWEKTRGNDGKPRIRLPENWTTAVRPPYDRRTTGVRPPYDHPPTNVCFRPSRRTLKPSKAS